MKNIQKSNLKRKIALYMALIMVVSLLTPFATRPVEVLASVDLTPDIRVTRAGAVDSILAATFHAVLEPGVLAPYLRASEFDAIAPPGSVLINWPIAYDPLRGTTTAGEMYVLRFFDVAGRRHELTVMHIGAADGAGLMVNYDIYFRRPGGTAFDGYIHFSDPRRPVPPGDQRFQIRVPATGNFESAHQWFSNDGRNPGTDPDGDTILNRVNDRVRFVTPSSINYNFTYTHPQFPATPNDAVPVSNQDYFHRLAPSFNIGHGRGFTFRYMGINLHILWEHGQFFFYFEGAPAPAAPILDGGAIHEFTLERYTVNDALTYLRGNNAEIDDVVEVITAPVPPPAANQILGASSPAPHTTRGSVYVFMGIDRNTLNAIPFAQNAVSGAALGALAPGHDFECATCRSFADGTNFGACACATCNCGEFLVPHTTFIHTNPEPPLQGTQILTGVGAPTINTHAPVFNTGYLDMTSRPYPIQPTTPDVGMDIRFNLPGLFDETAGAFTNPLLRPGDDTFDSLEVWLGMNILADITRENFQVRFRLGDVPRYGPDSYNTSQFIMNPPGTHISLEDVSLLTRAAQPAFPDRVRIKVGNMNPSLAYDRVMLGIVPLDGSLRNFLGRQEAQVAGPSDPFYTFLSYRFTELAGLPFIQVEPFNHSLGVISAGWYTLRSTILGVGWAPQQIQGGAVTHLYFPLPRMTVGEQRNLWITRSVNNPAVPMPPGTPPPPLRSTRYSQRVWWSPDGDPTVSLPNNFSIDNVLNRPVQGDQHSGHLTYTASWDIGTWANLMAIVEGRAERDEEYLELVYVIGHSTSPESQLTNPDHRDYMRVYVQIRMAYPPLMVPGPGGVGYVTSASLQVRYKGEFLPSPPNPPHRPGILNHDWNFFADPIVNNDRLLERVGTGWVNHDWNPSPTWQALPYRMDPLLGETVFFASIDIDTDSVRRYRPVPPPPTMRDDFSFPGLYFMNVRLDRWNFSESQPSHAWSLFDYIVINDVTELPPPPPSNLMIAASTDPEAPPELAVSFGFPMGAIRTYLNTLYEMDVQLFANLYIGQFEAAIMDTFFRGPAGGATEIGQPLHPDRRAGAVVSVPFANVFSFDDDPAVYRFELDLSSVQDVLRGEHGGSGVVRVTDIPIVRTTAAAVVSSPRGLDIVNHPSLPTASETQADELRDAEFPISTPGLQESFDETQHLINLQSEHTMVFHLTGLEENRAYFVFTDLAIQKFTPVEDEYGVATGWQVRQGRPAVAPDPAVSGSPAVSDLTGVATATTVGTPQVPGPGEVGPSAPTGLEIYPYDQMSATVRWNPHILTVEEANLDENDIPRVWIEWEILRLQDGQRLTEPQMRDRNPNFTQIFNSLTDAPRRKGWTTSGPSLTVVSMVDPASRGFIEEPNDGTYYNYDPNIVELIDMTLLPNNLYFFYVRTVRVERVFDPQLGGYVEIRSTSVWVEDSVTTTPIQPPINLRQENPGDRYGFCGMTMALVSWEHEFMGNILYGMSETPPLFLFQYQIREGEGPWSEAFNVPLSQMLSPNARMGDYRVQYLLTGLMHSSVYQMRVRLLDVTSGDTSTWSNVITILTEHDPDDDYGEDDWLEFLRRQLEDLLRRPFWFAQNTPTSSIMVYRPGDTFNGLLLGTPGTAIPLNNTDAGLITYYLPASIIWDANNARRGFSTRYSDLDILLAPSFLSRDHNQVLLDKLRALDARGSDLSDFFIRMEIERTPMDDIHGVPGVTRQTTLNVATAGTNENIRNIRTWDINVQNRAQRIIDDRMADPVLRQNISNLLRDGISNEDMIDYVNTVVAAVDNQITRMVGGYMTTAENGILHETTMPIHDFDAAMHVVVTGLESNVSVNGFSLRAGQWLPQNLTEFYNGNAITARAPGTFAFTGRAVNIPGISEVAQGSAITSLVARFGLEDMFGLNVDLEQNATRHMVIGSMARLANAPHGADPMTWAASNLPMQMSSRNPDALISRQEAIAAVMALYELRTNTRISQIQIRNFQNTANMTLDQRYAQAVRAAFEIGLIDDTDMNPGGPITIGEFLDMVAAYHALLPL